MSELVQEAHVALLDLDGRLLGELVILSKDKAIRIISSKEAKQSGEEPVQLFEGHSYEYELLKVARDLQIRESSVVKRSLVHRRYGDAGRIETGNHTGLLQIVLENDKHHEIATAAVEVCSVKLSYREDYRQMLEDIAEKTSDLLMELRAPAQMRLLPDPGRDAASLQQRLAFLKALLNSREFHDALQQIAAAPHQRLERERVEEDVRKSRRIDNQGLKQIARATRRVPIPSSHPLGSRLKNIGVSTPTVPRRVTTPKGRDVLDIPENRFVKHVLQVFGDYLNKIDRALSPNKVVADRRLHWEVIQLQEQITSVLARDFFKEVSDPRQLPLGSIVLQRKAGYREILQAWLKFSLAAKLIWVGGEDVYAAGKRDIATLYEYWIFFQLLDLISSKFDLQKPPVQELIENTKDGFGLKLKAGTQLILEGQHSGYSRELKVRYGYNQAFNYTSQRGHQGSWTRSMRPDYTLSFWPAAFSLEEAEQQELASHLHFDAKYRVESLEQLFGSEAPDLQTEKADQFQGKYRRADLLKMHAYRDAIKRTEGAYVLYPGRVNKAWYGFHEILPGLGAFVLRPSNVEGAEGLAQLSEFIDKVIHHLCNRATQRERVTYHIHRVYKEAASIVKQPVPEKKEDNNLRAVPPTEHYVLIAPYDNTDELNKIINEKAYLLAAGSLEELSKLPPELALCYHILLYEEESEVAKDLFKITERGPRLLFSNEDVNRGDDQENSITHIEFKIEVDSAYEGWRWDLDALPIPTSASPQGLLILSLDKVLVARKTAA